MKKPSKIRINILLILFAVLIVAGVVWGLWKYGRYRAEQKETQEMQQEVQAAEEQASEEQPSEEPADTADTPETAADTRAELLSRVTDAMDKNKIRELSRLLCYRDPQGEPASYEETMLADCVLYLKDHRELYDAFRALLQAETTEITGTAEDGCFLLAGENLRQITGTPEPTPETEAPGTVTEPTPTVSPGPEDGQAAGWKIAIDPGHQARGSSEQEPVGPGADQMKARVSSGTYGAASGLNEYELNLAVSLKLRDELSARGYEIYMIRETNDVDISNKERAEMAAASGADILVRIHANGSENPSVQGALTMSPSGSNPYVGGMADRCQELSQEIIDAFCAVTGAENRGVYITDDMSGINWSTIPVTIVEMGYMTNAEEDLRMASEDYQALMVRGIADGIDAYFEGR
jgi:N-acetylmuramoyl-L-alanine amidase